MSVKYGRVYLVGAGCGDYDLITVRGRSLLEACDTVVYDSLIDDRLLSFVPKECEKICVGKRSGRHSETQENINRILIEKAKEGKIVVRLKGGDPFVFGRGGEEILALQKENIEYSVVPGVTSAVAVPELAGIPVTHRELSRSFHVITGHTKDDFSPDRFSAYAKLDGTLIFLMGLSHLNDIARDLIKYGKKNNTPAAVISNGASRSQRIVRGTLESIYSDVTSAGLTSPAVIVIGDTVGFDFSEKIKAPLKNVTVTVTGTKSFVMKLSDKLTAQGADTFPLDFLAVREYKDNTQFDNALQNITYYSMVVLTSINGVEIFFNRLSALNIDIRILSGIRFAVTGSGTAQALKSHGIFPNIIPDEYTTAALAKKLVLSADKENHLLILRAEKGSPQLTEILDDNNILYDEIKIYDVVTSDRSPYKVNTDYVTFASASGVQAFFETGYTVSDNTQIVCIGEVTADMLKHYVREGFSIANTNSTDGITQLIKSSGKMSIP
ncbi:MAG: uroporphyrinogen-III C-methyltransferase [Acutalibacteraceae bacterium]|nr:uroporphyrinogen-III C-methyltransferase [Acutalibacteraceae bacterium]